MIWEDYAYLNDNQKKSIEDYLSSDGIVCQPHNHKEVLVKRTVTVGLHVLADCLVRASVNTVYVVCNG